MILGLDASSTVCGWCTLNPDGTVAGAGHVPFESHHDLYQRLRVLQEALVALGIAFTHIYIEEPKKMFGNKSTAHVMSLLQRWNGMVSAMVSLRFVDPILVNEKTARKQVGVQIPHKSSDAKLLTARHVQESGVLPPQTWAYKRTGKLKDHCCDIADAYIVARAGYLNAAAAIS